MLSTAMDVNTREVLLSNFVKNDLITRGDILLSKEGRGPLLQQ